MYIEDKTLIFESKMSNSSIPVRRPDRLSLGPVRKGRPGLETIQVGAVLGLGPGSEQNHFNRTVAIYRWVARCGFKQILRFPMRLKHNRNTHRISNKPNFWVVPAALLLSLSLWRASIPDSFVCFGQTLWLCRRLADIGQPVATEK